MISSALVHGHKIETIIRLFVCLFLFLSNTRAAVRDMLAERKPID